MQHPKDGAWCCESRKAAAAQEGQEEEDGALGRQGGGGAAATAAAGPQYQRPAVQDSQEGRACVLEAPCSTRAGGSTEGQVKGGAQRRRGLTNITPTPIKAAAQLHSLQSIFDTHTHNIKPKKLAGA